MNTNTALQYLWPDSFLLGRQPKIHIKLFERTEPYGLPPYLADRCARSSPARLSPTRQTTQDPLSKSTKAQNHTAVLHTQQTTAL